MDWNYIVGDFCESKLFGHPEILNSLTCFFISYFPYIGLKYSHIDSILIKTILCLLFINGFASFGFHWTGYYCFKHFDEIPMVICIWLGLIYSFGQIGIQIIPYMILNLYFTLILVMNSIPSLGFLFPLTFGCACLLLIPIQKCLFDSGQINYNSKKHMLIGSLISISSALTWIVTENFCSPYMLFGHPVWHFGMPLGMYYIMIGFEYSNFNEDKYKIEYINHIIPVIKTIE